MNTNSQYSISPIHMVKSLYKNRNLIMQMAHREVVGRYKGSVIGLGWSFFNPILMLAVYTFVFSVIFQARWGVNLEETRIDFALILFTGLILHALMAEVLNRSPDMIINNTNYVKKVVFPLEILPVIAMGSALFHMMISFVVLFIAYFAVNLSFHWTVVMLPLTVIPLIFVTIGLAWIFASLGTFLRDIGQTVIILTMVMMFLAPIFYPMKAIPDVYHKYILMNPLTFIIQESRKLIMFGEMPNWIGLGFYWAMSLVILWLGFVWFQKTRRGFADVL